MPYLEFIYLKVSFHAEALKNLVLNTALLIVELRHDIIENVFDLLLVHVDHMYPSSDIVLVEGIPRE